KAMVLTGIEEPLQMQEMPLPVPNSDQGLVMLAAAALNKRDYWITKGKYPGIKFPLIPGSDGSGWFDGREVVINPGLDWGDSPAHFSKEFRILGMPEQGTLAEAVVIPL